MAARRMVVVGGDAAGMSAASHARRLTEPADLEIVAFERGTFTSYSACGIPYWIGGEVSERDELIARSPQEHRERGIDLRTGTEVTAVDPEKRRVATRGADGEQWTDYDTLVLATGARPVRPALPGIDAPGVHGVQSLEDGQALLEDLERTEQPAHTGPEHSGSGGESGHGSALRAVVVGAGYIGVEMAEALVRRGYRVTVLDQAEQPMTTLDPDMGRLVHDAMDGMGIRTVTGSAVTGIRTDAEGRACAVSTEGTEHPADIVVLGLGVTPETTLAREAGLPLGESGGLLTEPSMRVRGHPDVFAGGDCVEVFDLIAHRTRHIPLGTHANKQGQTIGANIGANVGANGDSAGEQAEFPGVVGTAVSKVCDLEIARTGLLESQAHDVGLRFVTVTADATSRAGYYPGARTMRVKMLAERGTGRLLGTQIVGREGAGKRVDIAAVALTTGLTVEQVTMLDLGYAPPFSPVWDPVQVAARKAVRAVREAN